MGLPKKWLLSPYEMTPTALVTIYSQNVIIFITSEF